MKAGHILFVTPDKKDDKVRDKIYDYDTEDDKELKELVQAVYREISSLNFIHNDELFLSADKSRSMKQVRDFVQKLIQNTF